MIKNCIFLLIFIVLISMLIFVTNRKKEGFKLLKFTDFQQEDEGFKKRRSNILNKNLGNVPVTNIVNFIDYIYHKHNKILHCDESEKNYLINMRKDFNKLHETIKYEKDLSNNQLVNYFGLEKNNNLDLINYLNNFVLPICLHLKNNYNRVRPQFCFKDLRSDFSKTKINVPNHASYPSGHATLAYFIFYFTGKHWKKADSIAKNREVAGVHYPSDTKFGNFIAYVLAYIIKNNELPKEENLSNIL